VAQCDIATLDDDLETPAPASPLWRAKRRFVAESKGMGRVCPHVAAGTPRVGTLTRQQIAALVGVAPLNCDVGLSAVAHHVGSRAHVRTDVLARSWDTFQPADQQSLRNGSSRRGKSKSRLTACMHKFLTMLMPC